LKRKTLNQEGGEKSTGGVVVSTLASEGEGGEGLWEKQKVAVTEAWVVS